MVVSVHGLFSSLLLMLIGCSILAYTLKLLEVHSHFFLTRTLQLKGLYLFQNRSHILSVI